MGGRGQIESPRRREIRGIITQIMNKRNCKLFISLLSFNNNYIKPKCIKKKQEYK